MKFFAGRKMHLGTSVLFGVVLLKAPVMVNALKVILPDLPTLSTTSVLPDAISISTEKQAIPTIHAPTVERRELNAWRSSFRIFILTTGKDWGKECEFRGRFTVEGEGGIRGMRPIWMNLPERESYSNQNGGRGVIIFDESWYHPSNIVDRLFIHFYESSEPFDQKLIAEGKYDLPKLNLTLLKGDKAPYCENVLSGTTKANTAVIERCISFVHLD